jgi:hypothetical protein
MRGRERPDPAWKRWLGLIADSVAGEAPFDPFSTLQTFGLDNRRPILFDDAVAPKQSTVLYTPAGAEALGLNVSFVTVTPATWRELEDNQARRSGAPWLAPVVEECIRAKPKPCSIDTARGFRALSLSLAEAMQVPAFATWANQADRMQGITQVPPDWLPVIPLILLREFRSREAVALTPDWSRGRWMITNQTGIAHVVFNGDWPADFVEPTFCSSEERCLRSRRSPPPAYTIVDWDLERVMTVQDQGHNTGPLVLRGNSSY